MFFHQKSSTAKFYKITPKNEFSSKFCRILLVSYFVGKFLTWQPCAGGEGRKGVFWIYKPPSLPFLACWSRYATVPLMKYFVYDNNVSHLTAEIMATRKIKMMALEKRQLISMSKFFLEKYFTIFGSQANFRKIYNTKYIFSSPIPISKLSWNCNHLCWSPHKIRNEIWTLSS